MCALFSYFHWLTMVAILQLKASKHFAYFVSIAVVTFTLLYNGILMELIAQKLTRVFVASQTDSSIMKSGKCKTLPVLWTLWQNVSHNPLHLR